MHECENKRVAKWVPRKCRAAGKVVLGLDFNVQVREGLADGIVEGPHAADAFESSRNQQHVAKGGSGLGESGAGRVPVVCVFRGNVCGYDAVLTFRLLFQSHGWGPYSALTSSIAPFLYSFQYSVRLRAPAHPARAVI